jgi:hypothetical protein
MTKLIKLLRPLNNLIWDYLVKNKFILFCGGGGGTTVIEQAAPRDMGEDARSYLEAVTDPELVGKQLDAEKQFGPQFDLVSLARTQTMLEGIKDPKESKQYAAAQAKRIALQAKKKSLEDGAASLTQEQIDAQIDAMLGTKPPERIGSGRWASDNPEYARYLKRKKVLEESYSGVNSASMAEVEGELAENLAIITQIEESEPQKGLLEMAQDAATAYAKTIRESNTLQREADIVDLETLGQRTTEALRKADPYSTGIADKATELAEQASTRALDGVQPTAERTAMGEIANRQRERISELEARAEEARTPAENEELNRLKQLRDQQQTALLDPALARAADPSSVAERQNLSMLAQQSMAAAQAPTDAGFLTQQANQQQLGQMGMDAATAAQARATNPMLADGRAELGQLADVAQAQALDPTSNAQRASMGDLANVAQGFAMDPTSNAERAELGNMAQQSRDFASSLMQQAQNPALPNEERQRLIAMSQQQEQRANSLYDQAQTPSRQRQAAGSLAQLSAQQARQLSADAMGPLSSQRRRMAEQAARQQGLRSGRIGDSAQLAAELLGREESRALLRAEAREAQDLAYQQASGFATDIETDAQRLREEGRLTTGQSFDMGRGIQSDLDQLTADRRSQALAAQGDARSATTDLIGIDKGFRDEAFGRQQDLLTTDRGFRDEASERQQALLDRDEALREEARLEREAASLEQRGLFEQAQSLRNEAATRRNEAATAQQNVADMDKSLRAEARSSIGDQVGLTAGLAESEEALRQQALRESKELRGEVAEQEAAAFASQGQLANFDEAARQNAIAESMNLSREAFGMNRAIGGDVGNVVLSRSSAAPGMGQAAVAGAPAASQAYQPLFGDAIGTGINIGQAARQTEQNRLNTQAEVRASEDAAKSSAFSSVAGAAMGMICWVAREVYGTDNPKWLQFREWLLGYSPSWFRNLYIKHGEKFAKFISNKPFVKNIIRKWMDTKIK